jgi:transposase
MYEMLKRHEVQVLRRAGHSQADVAKLTGVAERSIRRMEAEPPVTSATPVAQQRQARSVGRPSKAELLRDFVNAKLKEFPEMLSVELFRLAKLNGYAGKKTALYALIASVRPKSQRPLVRFEGLPGEFSQHDFGHVDVAFHDATKKRVHFFASRLKYSRFVQVTLVENEQAETIIRKTCAHFEAFGGVPLLAVYDRPKTIAIKWKKDGTITEWNTTFAQFMLEMAVGAEICWPYSGQQKGAVENLVGWVKGSFFKQRRFIDQADLEQQLSEWQTEVNEQTPSRATRVTPLSRMAEERARLRPLKILPQNLALRIPIYVGPTGFVLHETHEYSMPPESISISGTLFLHEQKVRIVAGRFEAEHPRLFIPHSRSSLPQHRSEMVAKVCGKRAKLYLKREHLLETGPAAHAFLTELVHRRPRQWSAAVHTLHALLEKTSPAQLDQAFALALANDTIGEEYIKHYLDFAKPTPPAPALGEQGLLPL